MLAALALARAELVERLAPRVRRVDGRARRGARGLAPGRGPAALLGLHVLLSRRAAVRAGRTRGRAPLGGTAAHLAARVRLSVGPRRPARGCLVADPAGLPDRAGALLGGADRDGRLPRSPARLAALATRPADRGRAGLLEPARALPCARGGAGRGWHRRRRNADPRPVRLRRRGDGGGARARRAAAAARAGPRRRAAAARRPWGRFGRRARVGRRSGCTWGGGGAVVHGLAARAGAGRRARRLRRASVRRLLGADLAQDDARGVARLGQSARGDRRAAALAGAGRCGSGADR